MHTASPTSMHEREKTVSGCLGARESHRREERPEVGFREGERHGGRQDDGMESYLSQCYHLESILSGGD